LTVTLISKFPGHYLRCFAVPCPRVESPSRHGRRMRTHNLANFWGTSNDCPSALHKTSIRDNQPGNQSALVPGKLCKLLS